MEVALVHRPRYDDWSLPKGKVDDGESMPAAAVREVEEETGFRCRLGALVGDVHYNVSRGCERVPKLVRYWAAQERGGAHEPNHETDELRWCAPEEAAALLTYPHDAGVLRTFTDAGPPDSLLLLVRHAKAGSRDAWDGDDDLRPLSGKGRDQARRIAALLPLFGPDRLATAPPLRCRDTIIPFAEAADLDVPDEPLLGEAGYWDDPDAALARVRELAALPGVTAVCSQGRVIPDLVSRLTDRDDVESRKASVWVLGFTGGSLRTADYYRHPSG